MSSLIDFMRKSGTKIWEGFLQNLGVIISAFLLSGGYLIAINEVKKFQEWVRLIPTEYVLTPFVLLLIASIALIRINRKQQEKISKFEREPRKDERDAKFVTHLGVWWKIYRDSEYIEDFPYCACCVPGRKLVQTEWHPDEIYKCSKTDTEYKLYDGVPQGRQDILKRLYRVYFEGLGTQFGLHFRSERNRLKELYPDISNQRLTEKLFAMEPLCKIPKEELLLT